jgi:hypothetical protein
MRVEADSGMRKQKKLLVVIAFIAASLAASVSLFFGFHRKPEPIYAGCTLSYWAERYAKAYFSNQRAFLPSANLGYAGVDAEAEEAIRAIGTNALPFVVKWLHFEQAHSSVRLFYSLRLNRLSQPLRDGMHAMAFKELARRRAQRAYYVLQILGPQASPVAPDLLRLCNNSAEPDTAYRCFAALGALGTNALPQLMQVIRDANHPYRGVAVRQVEEVLQKASPSSIQFPVLLQCLRDRDTSLVTLTCMLLGRAGPNQAAVPFLQTNLLSPDPAVRVAASNALIAISSTAVTNVAP